MMNDGDVKLHLCTTSFEPLELHDGLGGSELYVGREVMKSACPLKIATDSDALFRLTELFQSEL